MSGPVGTIDAPPTEVRASAAKPACVEITPSREAAVGSMPVRRALPRRERRTVGAWCFADHMGPELVTETQGLDIGPHPHTGLQTVTWLVAGEVLHRDSLGTEQVIRAGQLNLMTAGNGVTHSEEATGRYRGQLHGVQLWVAQPEATRHGPAAFAHHAELPAGRAGQHLRHRPGGQLRRGGVAGPARHRAGRRGRGPAAGDRRLAAGAGLRARPGRPGRGGPGRRPGGRPGQLAYLGIGRGELALSAGDPARVLLLGGEPFGEPILMWWNFVARSRAELEAAYRQWESGDPRFGRLRSPLARIPAPPPFWARPT